MDFGHTSEATGENETESNKDGDANLVTTTRSDSWRGADTERPDGRDCVADSINDENSSFLECDTSNNSDILNVGDTISSTDSAQTIDGSSRLENDIATETVRWIDSLSKLEKMPGRESELRSELAKRSDSANIALGFDK
jgi:hypothetical protein